jgi:hypothetical protein
MESNRTRMPEACGAVRRAKQREWGTFLATSSALLLTAGSAILLASELHLTPGLGHLGLGERFAALGEARDLIILWAGCVAMLWAMTTAFLQHFGLGRREHEPRRPLDSNGDRLRAATLQEMSANALAEMSKRASFYEQAGRAKDLVDRELKACTEEIARRTTSYELDSVKAMSAGEAAAMLAHVLEHYRTRNRPRERLYAAAELELLEILLSSARVMGDIRQDGEELARRVGLEKLFRGLFDTGPHRRMFAECSRFLEEFERYQALLDPEREDETPDAPATDRRPTARVDEPEAARTERTSAGVTWLGNRRMRRG